MLVKYFYFKTWEFEVIASVLKMKFLSVFSNIHYHLYVLYLKQSETNLSE